VDGGDVVRVVVVVSALTVVGGVAVVVVAALDVVDVVDVVDVAGLGVAGLGVGCGTGATSAGARLAAGGVEAAGAMAAAAEVEGRRPDPGELADGFALVLDVGVTGTPRTAAWVADVVDDGAVVPDVSGDPELIAVGTVSLPTGANASSEGATVATVRVDAIDPDVFRFLRLALFGTHVVRQTLMKRFV
jgi:hypothetical protein